jgi:hypothetical protein
MDRLVILPIDAQIHVSVPPLHLTPTDLKLLQMQTKFEEIKSASTMDRRVTLLLNAATHVLALLLHCHLLQHHHPTRKPEGKRKCI